EIKDGKQKSSLKKVFPGYILVNMILTDETWYAVKQIKGVFSFVGTGEKPLPLTEAEMKSLGIGEIITLDYNKGDLVRIITEPFFNYPATVEEIFKEKGKVKVTTNMFGRKTTVELNYNQIQKI
ncbi:MAG: transcription termination/antitermination NusG family protein, partial [Clostridia bacterium]